MIKQLVGIFDRKAQSFVEISATEHLGVAARLFTEAVNTKSESPIYKWPNDFELYHLGNVDTETGALSPVDKKLVIQGETIKVRE